MLGWIKKITTIKDVKIFPWMSMKLFLSEQYPTHIVKMTPRLIGGKIAKTIRFE